jgi:hypothetical protein
MCCAARVRWICGGVHFWREAPASRQIDGADGHHRVGGSVDVLDIDDPAF